MARCAEFSAALSRQCASSFASPSPQPIKHMAAIHDEIDNWLAANLHDELSDTERSALHAHLVDCGACRKTHQELKTMNKILEETVAHEKPDPAFEQRMLAGFRNRIPQRRGGFAGWVADLIRLRSVQITVAAAVLLGLDHIGQLITGENSEALPYRKRYATDYLAAQSSQIAASRPSSTGGLAKSNQLAEGRSQDLALGEPLPPSSAPANRSEFQEERAVRSKTMAPAKAVAETPENLSRAEQAGTKPAETPAPALANRKLIRNATVELEIVSFDDAVQKITAFANEEHGYVATTNSDKQANGKLRGQMIVKVLPENLDRFLQKLRGVGELKNQTPGNEAVTKAYFDADARLKNARVMEQRLIDMLKTKTGKVSDLLQVEKELGRVREEIEKMQGELKYWDSQVQFARVTISLAEKDMEEPASFLLKEHAQLALYASDVEKIYNDIKGLASPKVQITNAQLDRDYSGRVSARVSMLIAPEESDGVIDRVKGFGRVENFQTQTERIAQGGSGISENAKTKRDKRDKVELNVAISHEEQEQAFQQTSLRIRTSSVDEKAKELRALAEKQGGRVRSSTFSRDPDGRAVANVSLRVPMKNYLAIMQSLDSLGKVENVSVQRQDRTDTQINEASAPADVSIQVYSQGNIVTEESGLLATLRRTLTQSAGAIMWSLRMIGVAIAFLAPWAIAIVGVIWVGRRIIRAKR